jgi:hypothetical protein
MKAFKELKSHHKIIFALIIGFAVISFWRGVWELSEIYIFPGNLVISLWTSLIMGTLILVITGYIMKELT